MNRKQRRATTARENKDRTKESAKTAAYETERSQWGGMKLITAEIENELPPYSVIGEDENWLNPTTRVVARFFAPVGAATWYIVAGSRDTKRLSRYEDDFLCFGYATLDGSCWDWGTISVKELEEVQLPFGLHVERDLFFRPCTLAERFPQEFGKQKEH